MDINSSFDGIKASYINFYVFFVKKLQASSVNCFEHTGGYNQKMSNPILPGLGVCDPHVRIINNRAYLYATHDRSLHNTHFIMDDWWIWSSPDLEHW